MPAGQLAGDHERIGFFDLDQRNVASLRRGGVDRLDDLPGAGRGRLVHQHRPQFVEHFGEDERVALREGAVESDRNLAILFVDFDQVEEAQHAQRPFVEGNGTRSENRGERVALHKGGDEGDRVQVVAERLLSLLTPLFEIEFIRRLKDDLEGLTQALAAVSRVFQHRKKIAELPRGRDAQLVPVDKGVFDRLKRL